MEVFRQAITRWGTPEAIVSDHGAVFVALQPCLDQLAVQWAPIVKVHPWQNLAESGFAVQRRMLDAYVLGCTERTTVYRQQGAFGVRSCIVPTLWCGSGSPSADGLRWDALPCHHPQ